MTKEEQDDALRELGNVAFSHGATALSTLVGRRVEVSLPSVRIETTYAVAEAIAYEEERVYIVTLRILGDQQGLLLLVFRESDALALADMLEDQPVGTSTRLTRAMENVLAEVANIMSGAALLAMYRFLRISLIHGTPALRVHTRDEAERRDILLGAAEDQCIVVEAEFAVEERVARGEMVISLSDLPFFLDALAMYQGAH